ncbi:CRISPR-associated endonuclease Cas2 [Desulfonema magnum]|uniref:CRISPR-associated endoribonuclease Cas2 n=1 Tax=Desulfonema magnum TaxID=45655 RepID=A0A975GQZ8_9BACT|nr:CRISPR-associated endonuclease Cas2 [Desulfonema magnum]QTA90419.1 CRISPR-associated endonuclease Cas2 [Desulfonema magnum]
MERKGWYMVVYDIANPRRLGKVHRLLKKQGISAQKSVFFVKGTASWVNQLLDELVSVMAVKEDDLRAYPVSHPREVWATGPNPLTDFPVVQFEAARKIQKNKQASWFKQIFKIIKFSRAKTSG